jgi:thiamine-monophosphate kinase
VISNKSKSKNKPQQEASKRVSEFSLIDSFMQEHTRADARGLVGYGDDCAVIPLSLEESLLVTVDTLVDEVHFSSEFSSMYDIGWKTLAASLSDVYAMGGKAESFFVSLQINQAQEPSLVNELYRGMSALAESVGVQILGGDTVFSKTFAVSGTLLGRTLGDPILRSGAKDGDLVWVGGTLGESSAGLALLKKKLDPKVILNPEICIERHRRPDVRSSPLLNIPITSMIDVSDGVFQDAGHICKASGVDIHLDLDKIVSPFSCEVSERQWLQTVSGGEDFQLLFTTSPEQESLVSQTPGVSCIGRVLKNAHALQRVFVSRGGAEPRAVSDVFKALELPLGYQHF